MDHHTRSERRRRSEALALAILAGALLPASATPQESVVLPTGYARYANHRSSATPWGVLNGPLRAQYILDRSVIGDRGPVVIDRLRWRAASFDGVGGPNTTPGGTYANVEITLDYAYNGWTSNDSRFAYNSSGFGAVAYQGPVTVGTPSGALPNDWFVDIPLSTPFSYQPQSRDLLIEITIQANGWSGGATPPACESVDRFDQIEPNCRQVVSTASATAASGTSSQGGPVVEVGYQRFPSYAFSRSQGPTCWVYDTRTFELFNRGSFDLAGSASSTSTLRFERTDLYRGYVQTNYQSFLVKWGPDAWFAPTSPPLPLNRYTGTPSQHIVTPPFPVQIYNNTYTSIVVHRNGYISGVIPLGTIDLPDPSRLFLAPFWTHLQPAVSGGSGTVHFDVDPSNTVVYVTWLGVQDHGTPGTSHTFQAALFQNGDVEFRYRDMTPNTWPAMVGWQGRNVSLDGFRFPKDLSAELPFYAGAISPFRITTSSRPVIQGGTLSIQVDNPYHTLVGSTAGVLLLGIQPILPAPLDLIGMEGCSLQVLADVASVGFGFAADTALVDLPAPGSPTWDGLQMRCQAFAIAVGANTLGVLASNARELTFGIL